MNEELKNEAVGPVAGSSWKLIVSRVYRLIICTCDPSEFVIVKNS